MQIHVSLVVTGYTNKTANVTPYNLAPTIALPRVTAISYSKKWPNVTDRAQMIEGSTTYCADMILKSELLDKCCPRIDGPATLTCMRVDSELSLLRVPKRTASVLSELNARPL